MRFFYDGFEVTNQKRKIIIFKLWSNYEFKCKSLYLAARDLNVDKAEAMLSKV